MGSGRIEGGGIEKGRGKLERTLLSEKKTYFAKGGSNSKILSRLSTKRKKVTGRSKRGAGGGVYNEPAEDKVQW